MAKAKEMERGPVPGESLFLRNTPRYSSPHCHALYLGKDETGNKVLLPTYIDGYSIVNLESIDPEAYKPAGKFNLRSEEYNEDGPVLFDYIFFDVIDGQKVFEREVQVRKIEGRWMITSRPDNPTWSE